MSKSKKSVQLEPITRPAKKIANKNNCTVVDLFCGVGGMTHGFFLENFSVVAGLDIDDTCKYAYEHNNQVALLSRLTSPMIATKNLGALSFELTDKDHDRRRTMPAFFYEQLEKKQTGK